MRTPELLITIPRLRSTTSKCHQFIIPGCQHYRITRVATANYYVIVTVVIVVIIMIVVVVAVIMIVVILVVVIIIIVKVMIPGS